MVAVGIDISKQKIDVWTQDNLTTLANEKAVIRRFFKRFVGQEVQIVMEATGRYHRLTHEVLSELGLSVMVINPFQSRHFARALHVLCKTDKVDAKMLCLFAERMEYIPTPVLEENHRQLMDLIRHVDDLKSTRHGLIVRLKEATLAFVEASLKRSIETLDIEIKSGLLEIQRIVEEDPQMKRKREILVSIPAIGSPTAGMLLGLLSQLGTLTRNQLSALAGVAPMNCESGSSKGRRCIQKGRHDVRRHLYMPLLGAVHHHNLVLKKLYQRLIQQGKPAKVALVACMRKLLVIANGLIKKNELWQNIPNYA